MISIKSNSCLDMAFEVWSQQASNNLEEYYDHYYTADKIIRTFIVSNRYCIKDTTAFLLTVDHLPKIEQQGYKTIIVEKKDNLYISRTKDSVTTILNRSYRQYKRQYHQLLRQEERIMMENINKKLTQLKRTRRQNLPKVFTPNSFFFPVMNHWSREHHWVNYQMIECFAMLTNKTSLVKIKDFDFVVHLPTTVKLINDRYVRCQQLMTECLMDRKRYRMELIE